MTNTMYKVTPEGEYKELKYVATNLTSDAAILILDEDTMKIWVFKGENVPAMIKYKAGMASSTLNAKNGLKYRITHVEIAEYEKKALQLFSDYVKVEEVAIPGRGEVDTLERLSNETISRLGAVPRLDEKYSEDDKSGKAVPITKTEPTKTTIPKTVKKKKVAKPAAEVKTDFGVEVARPPIPDSDKDTLTDSVLEVVAAQILHDGQLDRIQQEALPARAELKKQLIKQVDAILDDLYS
ncbi:MAG: hypothetical protein KAR35_03860 [Candidatus Heimdallarchaeota archaeon]|nr:hypothetical protein [Candidatus Heimdallarchaeota archaeon]MCK5048490.1 hypothetical protein [Candidatus Heimdallarchaeota archaeon]